MVESTQVSPASFQVCKLYVFVHEVSHFPQAYVAFLAVGNLEQEIPHIYKYFFLKKDSQGLVLLKQRVVQGVFYLLFFIIALSL